jgi:small-conductance mechanosensitive channel
MSRGEPGIASDIYGISLLVATSLLLLLWRYAMHMRLVRPDVDDEDIQLLTRRLTPGLAAYLVLIIAGLFVPIAAAVGYLAVALFFFIPFRPIIRLHRPRPPQP